MEDYMKRYLEWLNSDKVDEETKKELRSIEGNNDEIEMRFGSYMEFGTGGLRSKMGAGCGMMNIYTVAQSTEWRSKSNRLSRRRRKKARCNARI